MIAKEQVTVGETRVAYEDMANPRREGIVVDVALAFGGLFAVKYDTGEFDLTDFRQAGWSLVGVATNDDLKTVETDSEEFAALVDTEWAKQMGGELLIEADAGDQQNRDLRVLVERMGSEAIENILMVGDGVEQMDAKGEPLPGNVVVEVEVARRVATALAVLFYGN